MFNDHKVGVTREIKRRKLLALLKQDEYISRYDLPSALATRRVRIRRTDLANDLSDRTTDGGSACKRAVLVPKDETHSESASIIELSENTSNKPIAFSLVGVFSDQSLWLENVTNDTFSADQFQLVVDMNFAIEGRKIPLQKMQFDWPLHDNSGLDHGADAARASLRGFLDRLRSTTKWERIFLLGDSNPITVSNFREFCSCIALSYSLRQMISQPERKRIVWAELQEYV